MTFGYEISIVLSLSNIDTKLLTRCGGGFSCTSCDLNSKAGVISAGDLRDNTTRWPAFQIMSSLLKDILLKGDVILIRG